ncbi:STAS-like domain-containing protein [Cereibacter sphaeroides]|uniref:STAS-like domain-containing protein n=1 Tax=Cereibacter sphaeroides TaxID=1063 RepID=UPI00155906A6|nr:STAS-like domain-containing protein [Cereibacter sphaeroides]
MLKLADFSRFPSGRDDNDGDYNGQKYRNEILAPAFQEAVTKGRILEVSLEGVLNFGSSFLEEAFGGLVRKRIASRSDLKRLLRISPDTPYFNKYKTSIFEYIDNAKVEK